MADELCWGLSGDGIFWVKDVYAFASSSMDQASCSLGPDPVWDRLWKLKVPPKVREFACRTCWDIISHGVNLCKKGVSDFIQCHRCGKDENLRHLLFECPWSIKFWVTANVSYDYPLGSSFRDVVDWVWGRLGCKGVESFLTFCWSIWKARNKDIFNSIFDPPSLYVGNPWIGWTSTKRLCRMG